MSLAFKNVLKLTCSPYCVPCGRASTRSLGVRRHQHRRVSNHGRAVPYQIELYQKLCLESSDCCLAATALAAMLSVNRADAKP